MKKRPLPQQDIPPMPGYEGPGVKSDFVQDPSTIPENDLVEYEVSKDPEEWKFVEQLLPRTCVPPLPKHDSYPTSSGWFPPTNDRKFLSFES